MNHDQEKFKKFFKDGGFLSVSHLDDAEKEALRKEVSLRDELLSHEHLSESLVQKAYAYACGVPFVSLSEDELSDDVLVLIPEPLVRMHNVIPVKKENDTLFVACLDTENVAEVSYIEKDTGLTLRPLLTDRESLRRGLFAYQKLLRKNFGEKMREHVLGLNDLNDKEDEKSEALLSAYAEEESVKKLLMTLLAHARLQNASDIHIEPHEKGTRVRYRIKGVLYDAMELPPSSGRALIIRLKHLSGLKLLQRAFPQNGRCGVSLGEDALSVRVGTIPTISGEKMTVSLLSEDAKGFTLENLGFFGPNLEHLRNALEKKHGMILIAGPSRSGKTTTFYTLLDILNKKHLSIATVEDPVEYRLPNINQIQVSAEKGLTFLGATEALLRHDPDVIGLGEVRESSVLSSALSQALSGRRVLSVLHSEKRASEVLTILHKGATAEALSSGINAIVVSRLVKKLGPSKKKVRVSKEQMNFLKKHTNTRKLLKILREEGIIGEKDTWKDIHMYEPYEKKEGYEGVLGVHEVLPINRAIANLIREKATAHPIEEEAEKAGMVTLLEDGVMKAVQGKTTLEEIMKLATLL